MKAQDFEKLMDEREMYSAFLEMVEIRNQNKLKQTNKLINNLMNNSLNKPGVKI